MAKSTAKQKRMKELREICPQWLADYLMIRGIQRLIERGEKRRKAKKK